MNFYHEIVTADIQGNMSAVAPTALEAKLPAEFSYTVPLYRVGSRKTQSFLDEVSCLAEVTYKQLGIVWSKSTSIQRLDDFGVWV